GLYLPIPGSVSGLFRGYTFLYLEEYLGCERSAPGGVGIETDQIGDVSREWKVDFIRDNFSDNDVRRFLNIPLSKFRHDDYQVWRWEASGEFTVRSAYKALLQ
ncbi:hypothetical protein Gotri_006884, partial [Gossypium trilobum]|nr:hypothetical protein [Gossypium trilobum]